MINNVKNIAIVGFGSIANKHLSIIEKLYPKTNIYIVTKRDLKLKHKTYKNLTSLKNKDLDAIFITSPSNEHFRVLSLFYRKNINFFVEKPIFDKKKDIKSVLKHFSRQNAPVLQVGYVFRHDDLFLKFKSMCDSNLIGKVIRVEIYAGSDLSLWRPNSRLKDSISLSKDKGGGVLLELSHEIDYCLWLFGDLKLEFSNLNRSGMFHSKVEDTADLYLSSKKKVNISIHLNFWQKNSERYCKVYGTKGSLVLDILGREINLNNKKTNKSIVFKSKLSDAYKKQITNFFYSINHSKKSSISLSDSLKVLDIIEKAKLYHGSKKNV